MPTPLIPPLPGSLCACTQHRDVTEITDFCLQASSTYGRRGLALDGWLGLQKRGCRHHVTPAGLVKILTLGEYTVLQLKHILLTYLTFPIV